ncbi:MAG: NTP transferase domain-containing protein [Synergistaceae bacterium]|jgi:NDP-sugar pyrophosphorylase family protein|nr:NTP transferase domain-containing protein [Synergistaceae bacterium]
MLPIAILAGGLAKRIRPVTEKMPKALIDINGRPFIDYQLKLLASSGIKKAVLCVGFLGGQIEGHVGGGGRYGLNVEYSYDGENPLGTGGAIKKAIPLLGGRFFILYGDSYLPIDYNAVEKAFLRSEKSGLMTVYRNGGQWDTSNVVYAPGKDAASDGSVIRYDKKNPSPEMEYIDYGLSCCCASALDSEQSDTFDIADTFARLSNGGQLAGFEATERFYEIGSFAGMEDFRRYAEDLCPMADFPI